MLKPLSGHLQELKKKGKVQLGNPKSGRGRLREWSFTRAFHYKVTVQTGIHKGGCNKSWSLTRVVARRGSTVFRLTLRFRAKIKE